MIKRKVKRKLLRYNSTKDDDSEKVIRVIARPQSDKKRLKVAQASPRSVGYQAQNFVEAVLGMPKKVVYEAEPGKRSSFRIGKNQRRNFVKKCANEESPQRMNRKELNFKAPVGAGNLTHAVYYGENDQDENADLSNLLESLSGGSVRREQQKHDGSTDFCSVEDTQLQTFDSARK